MLKLLEARFQKNKNLHMELNWPDVEKRLLADFRKTKIFIWN